MSGFGITQGKGFSIKFANGWRISVQFGPGNYSDNYSAPFRDFYGKPVYQTDVNTESETAEIAIFNPNNKMVPLTGDGEFSDTVKGYCSADEVASYIAETAGRK